jgi:hypothetical protein
MASASRGVTQNSRAPGRLAAVSVQAMTMPATASAAVPRVARPR